MCLLVQVRAESKLWNVCAFVAEQHLNQHTYSWHSTVTSYNYVDQAAASLRRENGTENVQKSAQDKPNRRGVEEENTRLAKSQWIPTTW